MLVLLQLQLQLLFWDNDKQHGIKTARLVIGRHTIFMQAFGENPLGYSKYLILSVMLELTYC